MTFKRIIVIAAICGICILFLDSFIDRTINDPEPYERPLEIVKLSDNDYMHISYLKDAKGGYIGCNGYIFIDNNEALIFDTPITDSLSHQLINYIQEKLKAKVKGVVVNHSHSDASGGLRAFNDREISSYASSKTARLLAQDSLYISHPFETKQEIIVGNETVTASFFGEAHTRDNILSYIPKSNTIVGGCMVKSLNAPRGNINDANLGAWSQTVSIIKKTYPDVEMVVPGHGGYGDTALLDYTVALFKGEKSQD